MSGGQSISLYLGQSDYSKSTHETSLRKVKTDAVDAYHFMYISMLLQYQEHLASIEAEIDVLAEEIKECKIIQSIPGIGGKIAPTIISEIGEIDRFNHPKKHVAYAGIDPSVHSSVHSYYNSYY
ncbi:Transposase IS116/IS110/IS902 family protein [Bacillus sp. OV322]|nr:Transposase IS116/IS110/IS902 family protein [Bacillus sp. OV322]